MLILSNMAVSSDVKATMELSGSQQKSSNAVPLNIEIGNAKEYKINDSKNSVSSSSSSSSNGNRSTKSPAPVTPGKEHIIDTTSTASTSSYTIIVDISPTEEKKLQETIDEPLPSARELSRVLCRIVDTEVYSDHDSEIALFQLKNWASKQNVSFGNHLADIGGLQQVLFFIEDNMNDCACIDPALMLMETLCKPLHGASHTMYESKALSMMRTKIGKCIVAVNGVDLMLQTFQRHPLEQGRGSTTEHSIQDPDGGGEASCHMEVISNPCGFFDFRKTDQVDHRQLKKQRITERLNTARHSLEVLVLLIPHAVGVHKDAPTKILETLCEGVPILLKDDDTRYSKSFRALIAALMTCLVATSAIASKDTLAGPKLQRAKTVVSVTNLVMRNFPRHHGINRDGCFLFQRICRHLPKSERKRLGVVASLGSILASESIDQDVKDIADEILEEQFQ